MKKMIFYQIGTGLYTIDELREGYKIITGLDNGDELSDDEMYKYMRNALTEEE